MRRLNYIFLLAGFAFAAFPGRLHAQPDANEQLAQRVFMSGGYQMQDVKGFDKLSQYILLSPDSLVVLNVLHLGDSHIKTGHYTRSMQQYLNRYFMRQPLLYKTDDNRVVRKTVFINVMEYSFVGAKVGDYIKSDELKSYLATNKPQLVIISLGTNDVYSGVGNARFAQQLQQLTASVEQASPGTTMMLVTPPDAVKLIIGKSPVGPMMHLRQTLQMQAMAKGIPFWDLYAAMGNGGSYYRWQRMGLAANDGVHYQAKGYTLFGVSLAQTIFQRIYQLYFGRPYLFQ